MPKDHTDRTITVTCNFTHPSKQVPPHQRVFRSEKYTYDFKRDDLSRSIVAAAKRKYAAELRIKPGWIGHIVTATRVSNVKADSYL